MSRKRATLREMSHVAFDESLRIRDHNTRLGAKGYGNYPKPEDTRRAEVLEDMAKLADAIEPIKKEVAALIKAHAQARNAELRRAETDRPTEQTERTDGD